VRALPGVNVSVTKQSEVTKLAVLGSPIAHSRSPVIHRAAYGALNLDWNYRAIEIKEIELQAFLANLSSDWLGFSITMPLKRRAFELCVSTDSTSKAVRVVNTLVRREEGWAGYNTDVGGAAAALRPLMSAKKRNVAVFGAGATATSVAYALAMNGVETITFFARRASQVEEIAAVMPREMSIHHRFLPLRNAPPNETNDFNETLSECDLLVNTLPNGVIADFMLDDQLPAHVPLFDVIYGGGQPLSAFWERFGGTSVQGIELLIQQALLQIRIFVNGDPAVPVTDEDAVLEAMRLASVE